MKSRRSCKPHVCPRADPWKEPSPRPRIRGRWLRQLSSRDSVLTSEVILCEYPRDPQAVVEDERMVTGLVPSAPHLHDAKLALHPELALARESQVEDSIREILLLVPRICRPGRPVRTRIGRQLA